MQPFLLEKKPEIEALCRKHHVQKLWVFGSAVRDDFDPERSDVDFLVEFGDVPEEEYAGNWTALYEALQQLTGREVDMLTRKYLRNAWLKKVIESEEKELYVAA